MAYFDAELILPAMYPTCKYAQQRCSGDFERKTGQRRTSDVRFRNTKTRTCAHHDWTSSRIYFSVFIQNRKMIN